jgi:hypothetical protein
VAHHHIGAFHAFAAEADASVPLLRCAELEFDCCAIDHLGVDLDVGVGEDGFGSRDGSGESVQTQRETGNFV